MAIAGAAGAVAAAAGAIVRTMETLRSAATEGRRAICSTPSMTWTADRRSARVITRSVRLSRGRSGRCRPPPPNFRRRRHPRRNPRQRHLHPLLPGRNRLRPKRRAGARPFASPRRSAGRTRLFPCPSFRRPSRFCLRRRPSPPRPSAAGGASDCWAGNEMSERSGLLRSCPRRRPTSRTFLFGTSALGPRLRGDKRECKLFP
jgi:hypothetical protein